MSGFQSLKKGMTITSDQGAKRSYQLNKRIGKGSFGELWSAQMGRRPVGIKFEKREGEQGKPQLPLEFQFYLKLGQHRTVPMIYDFFKVSETPYHCLVMEMLGKSLEGMLKLSNHKMSAKNVLQIGVQLMDCIEYFHSRGLIHRDIKPDNFLFGRKESKTHWILRTIDLGLAKSYIDDDGKHIPFHGNAHIMGTQKFMPIHAHQQLQQSRRDDLEAIGYMLIYLSRGNLPWDGIRDPDGMKQNNMVLHKKQSTTMEELLRGVPPIFGQYLAFVKKLKFKDDPDYEKYRSMIQNYAKQSKIKLDDKFDFDEGNESLTLNSEKGSNAKLRDRSSQ